MTTAGFAHLDVTPALGCAMAGYGSRTEPARGLRDALWARAMVLESHGTRLAVVGADLIGVDAELVAEVRGVAERACGIPPEAVLICATHTHFGPALRRTGYLPEALEETVRPEYVEGLAAKLGWAVALADSRRAPARIGVGAGWSPLISFNRRPLEASGQCRMAFAAPPETAAWAAAEGARAAVGALGLPGLGPTPLQPPPSPPTGEEGALRWGPTDPQVPAIRVEGERGPLGGLVSFACHPVCGAGDDAFYDLSADYPWACQQALSATLGCPVVFALGCAGDQVPIVRGPGSRERVGRSLAAEVLRIWDAIPLQDEVPLAAARRSVSLPLKNLGRMAPPEGDDAQSRYLRSLKGKHGASEAVETEVQALRVGPMGVVSLPGEVFVEIGHAIRRESPLPLAMPISLGNDSQGYIPTAEAYEQGGYEPEWNVVAPGAGAVLTRAAVEALHEVAS